MCWSKHEREQWERERGQEREAERIRMVSDEPKPDERPEAEEPERELVRA